MKARTLAFSAAVALSAAMQSTAHHSFAAEFDAAKHVSLTGTVTKVQWRNPHTYFFVDVADEKGAIHNWSFELGSPNVLTRRGWKPNTLKEGDMVTVEGSRARDGTYKANAQSVKLADGKQLFNGSNADNAN